MKTINYAILLLASTQIFSCTKEVIGPAGPPGPEGPTGAQGESAYIFEYSNVDFVAPDYEVILDYPADFEGKESDVALVYVLWEVTTDNAGNNIEIWRQLPQVISTVNGDIRYNFDFTMSDVRLFMVTEFDPGLLAPIDTDDWVVRTVIVPGNFWGGKSGIDYSDYNAVKEAYGLPDIATKITTTKRR